MATNRYGNTAHPYRGRDGRLPQPPMFPSSWLPYLPSPVPTPPPFSVPYSAYGPYPPLVQNFVQPVLTTRRWNQRHAGATASTTPTTPTRAAGAVAAGGDGGSEKPKLSCTYLPLPGQITLYILKPIDGKPPWELLPGDPRLSPVRCTVHHVSTKTPVGNLLRGLGDGKLEVSSKKLFQVTPGRAGDWHRGACFYGDNEETMKKKLGEVGWGEGRRANESKNVQLWLYVVDE